MLLSNQLSIEQQYLLGTIVLQREFFKYNTWVLPQVNVKSNGETSQMNLLEDVTGQYKHQQLYWEKN